MRKFHFISYFVLLTLMPVTVFAGGTIFGHHKSRVSNPNGVSSIGIHICGSLNCPDVILKKGDCGTVEHATKKYGVCVCDDGFQVQGDKCVSKAPSCDKLDKVRKTYYIGACCDVPVEGLFCPEEDPPTCEKMDETTCAVTTETDCENAGGDWVCNGTSCRCAPHGSNTCCPGGGDCIACKPDEEQKCSIMAEGTCRKDGIKADCNDVYCIACSNGLIPDCSLGVIPEERCQCVEENCPNVYGELSTGENTGTSPIGTLSDGTQCYCYDLASFSEGRCQSSYIIASEMMTYENAQNWCISQGKRLPTWEGLSCFEWDADYGSCYNLEELYGRPYWVKRKDSEKLWIVGGGGSASIGYGVNYVVCVE